MAAGAMCSGWLRFARSDPRITSHISSRITAETPRCRIFDVSKAMDLSCSISLPKRQDASSAIGRGGAEEPEPPYATSKVNSI